MKSKKAAPKKKVQQVNDAPIEQIQQAPMQIQPNVNFQQAQMTNAQQQQLYNYQQQQQQIPQINSNSLMNNAQMQMNANINIAPQMNMMQMPIQQMAPQANIGMYGRNRTR